MCLKHPLKPKSETDLFVYSIEEYEKKWGEYEQNVIDGKITEIEDENRHLENRCVYGYNTELLYHLLTSPRRKRFYHETVAFKDWGHQAVKSRTLAAMTVSGDHSTDDIEKTLLLSYQFGYRVTDWVSGWDVVPYENFTEFKVIIDKVAGPMKKWII
jgi:hypothetical protein